MIIDAAPATPAPDKFGWRVPEWAAAVGLSRATVYELLSARTIASVKHGASRIIVTHPREFLASLGGGAV